MTNDYCFCVIAKFCIVATYIATFKSKGKFVDTGNISYRYSYTYKLGVAPTVDLCSIFHAVLMLRQ